jgi:transcriptional antiterminator NusG
MSETGETPDAIQAGRTVRVVEGGFRGMEGEVRAVDPERRRVTLVLDLFGIHTPVDLSFDQVKPLEFL